MALDPSIPMSFNPVAQGPNFNAALQGARNAWQLNAQQREAQADNVMRQIFTDPASLDKAGNPTPESMRRVMSVSPEAGMKLRQNTLIAQQHALQADLLKTKTFQQKYQMTNDVADQALTAYQTAIDAGVPKDVALQRGQSAWTQGMDSLKQSGLFSEGEQKAFRPQFDPASAQGHVWGYGDYMKWRTGQQREAREEAAAGERERHDRAVEDHQVETEKAANRRENRLENPDKWEVAVDPGKRDADGNPITYRYNLTDPTKSTNLAGTEPYVPTSFLKAGTQKQATPDMLTDPENLDASGKPTPYVYDKVKHTATTLDGKPYVPHSAEKLAGPSKPHEHWVVETDPLNKDEEGNPTPYRLDTNSGKMTTLDGSQEYHAKGIQRVGGPQKPLTENQQKAADLKAFADADIADAEKDGTKLSPKDKAAIHESYRLKALTDEQMAKDNAKAIPEETARNVAKQFVETGNQNILAGWRRSPMMLRQIENAITDEIKKQGLTPEKVARRSADFAAYTQGVKAFEAGGKLEPLVRAQGVAVGHLDILARAGKALRNGDTRIFNEIGNEWTRQTGGPAPTTFDGIKRIVAAELEKAVTGSAGALGDREDLAKSLDSANSPKQIADMIDKYQALMSGQLTGLKETYDRLNTGKDFDETYLDAAGRRAMLKYRGDTPNLPKAAVDRLKANPSEAAQFDKIFGPGAAKKVLGN